MNVSAENEKLADLAPGGPASAKLQRSCSYNYQHDALGLLTSCSPVILQYAPKHYRQNDDKAATLLARPLHLSRLVQTRQDPDGGNPTDTNFPDTATCKHRLREKGSLGRECRSDNAVLGLRASGLTQQ